MIKYIQKAITSTRGSLTNYHYISEVRTVRNIHGVVLYIATIQSWGTLEAFTSDANPIDSKSYTFEEPTGLEFNSSLYDVIYDNMLADTESLLYGGTLVVTSLLSETLESARATKWTLVKHWRSNSISTDMATPYGTIQCKDEDRQNITDAILLGQTLTAMALPVAIPWTLADNTVVTLDLAMLTNIGLLLGQKVQVAHARARELRLIIDNPSTTIEQLDALTWETV